MNLTAIQRVSIRTSSREWRPYREIAEPTLKALVRVGIMEVNRERGSRVRLTEKGDAIRAMLPPEPRPEWHDPAWRDENWGPAPDAGPVSIDAATARANGWPEGPWPWDGSLRP